MSLVDEKNVVARRIEKAPQVHGGVEQIIVVPDDYVTPLAQVQPQLKRADPVPPGSLGQGGPVIGDGAVQQVGQRILQPLVVAVGVGASLRQAGGTALSILAQAGLLLGRKGHAAQGKRRICRPQTGQRILSSGLCRVAGGQVEDLFSLALAHGFQGREEGAHRFADAGGCLAEQPGTALLLCLARSTGAIDLPGKGTLPGTVGRKRKLQGPKAPVPGFHPVQLPPCPGKILPQQVVEKRIQLSGGEVPGIADDLIGVDLVIGQPDIQCFQLPLLGADGPVDHALRPVAGVHVLRDGIGGRGGGLDLVDDHRAVLIGKNAVGTALDGEPDSLHRPLCREEHLGGVAFTRCLLEPAVDASALVGPVKAGKAAVDTAGAEQELHQLPDRETDGWHGVHFLSLEILRFSQAVQNRAYPRPRIF